MLREDHAVMDVAEQFGFDGCHSLTASPGRQPGTLQGQGVSYQLPLQSLCLEPKQGPSHWMLCLGWVLEEIFFFLKIYFTVLGAQQHYLSDRIMKLVEQHFLHLEMKSHLFHGNILSLLLDPSKGRAQRESFCVARGNYPKQPSWWEFEPEVLYRISPTSKIWSGCSYRKKGGGFQGWGWSSAIKFAMQLWRPEFRFLESM